MAQNQLAPAGKAKYHGIFDFTIAYTGGRTGNAVDLAGKMTLEGSDIEPMADVAESKGSDGEMDNFRPTNKRRQVSFSFAPRGNTGALAQAVANDLPDVKSLCTITCAGDAAIATPAGGSTVVDSAKAAYTPDGHLIVTMTVTHWIGKVFTAITE